MRKTIAGADRLATGLEDLGMIVAGLAFVTMVVSTAVDVMMRYVFNSPLIWAYPVVTNYLIVLLYFCSVAATQRHRHHIGIQLVVGRLDWRPRAVIGIFGGLATLMFCCLVAYCGFRLFRQAWDRNQLLPGIIAWPRWPTYVLIPVGFGLLSLRLLLQIVGDLNALARGVAPEDSGGVELVSFE